MKLYQTTLEQEWTNLIELKKQSIIRKIAVHEEDKGKIADIFERINRAREQLVVVTGLRVHKTVLAIQDDLAKLLLERLEASHAADHKSELEGDQRQLLRRAVSMPGTCVRILDDIARWANDTSPESQSVYWLFGQAGSGKSTIAYTIARRFEFAGDADDTIVLGGNFFCSRQIMETRSATRIIRTIIYHLALKCKAFADTLRASGKFDTIRHGVRAQLEGLLIEPWKQAQAADSSKSPSFLVVIDALDEIDGTGGSEFLRDLLDMINKNRLPGLKFFATSRPDPSLVNHLSSDDKHIVSGSEDKSVRVWDASTGEMLKVLEGHTEPVISVAFSSDDKCIISGLANKSVQARALATQQTILHYIRQKIPDFSDY